MAEAIVLFVLEQFADLIRNQIKEEVNLVRGVKKEVRYLSSELKTIQNVLEDAERRGYKEKAIQSWLHKLEEISYDIADVLDEWNYAILKLQIEGPDNPVGPKPRKVCPFIPSSSSSCFGLEKVATRRDIAMKIKGLKERMDVIVKEKNRFKLDEAQPVEPRQSIRVKTTSFVDVTEIEGRAADRDALLQKLIQAEGEECVPVMPIVIAIAGTGGIGKTTLAQQVYHDDVIKNCFKKRIWICVSDVSDDVKIAKAIVENLEGSAPNVNELDSLLNRVADFISRGDKFLLVLDDVWEEYCDAKWKPLKNSLKGAALGSKILITTRSEWVARKMGATEIHHLGLLSETDCCSLMRRIAFSERSEEDCGELKEISWKIASKCKGLPLAAKVLGSHLRFKDTIEEWENVLTSEIWKLEKAEFELFPHLSLSYNELSPAMKHCFSFCAFFPKDYRMDVEKLIRMWMVLGYLSSDGSGDDLELRGKEYFDTLKARSFFQEFEENDKGLSCKMHDIIHDFAQFLRKNKSQNIDGSVEAVTKELSQACDSTKVYRGLICDSVLPSSRLIKGIRILVELNEEEIKIDEIESLIHLRYLDLHNCTWLRRIPQAICRLYNLETLYLNCCRLKEIHKEIGNLIHLRHLDLSFNGELKEIPKEIGNLIHLRHLDLSFNGELKEIPKEIGNLIHLRHLDLSYNGKLKEIPNEIGNLIQLRHLNLRNIGIKEIPKEIGNLIQLRHLDLGNNGHIEEIPKEIGNLIQLRHLNLSRTKIKEIPKEIGNLIHLRHLDLSASKIKELPEIIYNLYQLRTLNLTDCYKLEKLPEGIDKLENLKHFINKDTSMLQKIPQGLGQLTGLRTLNTFYAGRGWSKCGELNKLDRLSGELELNIMLQDADDVIEAQKAKLISKVDIVSLVLQFSDQMGSTDENESLRNNVMEALQPPPNLQRLKIGWYKGNKFPGWITTSLNHLKVLTFHWCFYCLALPPLGKLPCLEELSIWNMDKLQFLGREFMGMASSEDIDIDAASSSSSTVFPKLEVLKIYNCRNLKEWEDITAEEEENTTLSIMPCLRKLRIKRCDGLIMLPHRLIGKASSLKELEINNL